MAPAAAVPDCRGELAIWSTIDLSLVERQIGF
jgi:hypothetical protein